MSDFQRNNNKSPQPYVNTSSGINNNYNNNESIPYYKSTHSKYMLEAQKQKEFSTKFTSFCKSKTAAILIQLFFNGMAVIIFIVNSYLISNEIEAPPLYHMILKQILLSYFILEYMQHMLNSSNKLQEFQKFTMMLDFITIIILSHDLYGNFTNKNNLLEDKFLYTLLCLKFLKVKTLIQSLVFKTHIERNADKMPTIMPQDEQLRQATFATVINIIVLCFINTSVILFVDEISGGQLLQPFQHKKLEFHNALYFQIITMTTIGYGDVTPIQTSGRVITTIFILICAVLFTKWFGKILNLVSKQDKSKNQFKKQSFDNIIIIGNMFQTTSHIEKFLKNHYSNKYSSKTNKFTRQLVFVTSQPPKHDPNAYIKFEGLRISYKIHKIKYVVVPSFESDLNWIKKAGLHKASALMCFNYEDNQRDAYNSERNIIFSLGLIKKKFPDLKIFIYFTTDLILNETKLLDSSKNISQRINCRKKYMNYCLTSSIENDGVGSLLQMLLLNKDKINLSSKNLFTSLSQDQDISPNIKNTLINYYQGSQNQIHCYSFPQFLIGESFVNIAKFLYLYSSSNLQQQSYNNTQIIRTDEKRIILIGVKSRQLKRVFPNPGHYRIKDGDKALFIAENEQSIQFFKNLTIEAKQYYDKNFEQPSLSIQLTNDILNEMIQASIQCARFSEDEYNTVNINLFNNPRLLDLSNHIIFAGVQEEDILDIYSNIRKFNPNRILVFINDQPFHTMPTRLKDQRNLFFIQCSLDDQNHLNLLQVKQCEKVVIRLVKDITHIQDIKLLRFYRLIQEFFPKTKILLSLNDERYLDFLDKRPLQQKLTWMYWPQVMTGNVILEPILFHSMNTLMYYEKSVSSLIMQIASISIKTQLLNNNVELNNNNNNNGQSEQVLGKQLSLQQQQQQYEVPPQMPSLSFLGGNQMYKGALHTFTITKRCAKDIKTFGDLQYHFLNRKVPFVVLALLKKTQHIDNLELNKIYDNLQGYSNNDDNEEEDDDISEIKDNPKQFLDARVQPQPFISQQPQSQQQSQKIKKHLLQEQVNILKYNTDSLLVNPPPYQTILNEGDKIITLGIIEEDIYKQERNTLNFLSQKVTAATGINQGQGVGQSVSGIDDNQKDEQEIRTLTSLQQSMHDNKIFKQVIDDYTPELFQQQIALTQDLIQIYQSYNQMLTNIHSQQ